MRDTVATTVTLAVLTCAVFVLLTFLLPFVQIDLLGFGVVEIGILGCLTSLDDAESSACSLVDFVSRNLIPPEFLDPSLHNKLVLGAVCCVVSMVVGLACLIASLIYVNERFLKHRAIVGVGFTGVFFITGSLSYFVATNDIIKPPRNNQEIEILTKSMRFGFWAPIICGVLCVAYSILAWESNRMRRHTSEMSFRSAIASLDTEDRNESRRIARELAESLPVSPLMGGRGLDGNA